MGEEGTLSLRFSFKLTGNVHCSRFGNNLKLHLAIGNVYVTVLSFIGNVYTSILLSRFRYLLAGEFIITMYE